MLTLQLELKRTQTRLSRSSQLIGGNLQNSYWIKHALGIVYDVFGEEGIKHKKVRQADGGGEWSHAPWL